MNDRMPRLSDELPVESEAHPPEFPRKPAAGGARRIRLRRRKEPHSLEQRPLRAGEQAERGRTLLASMPVLLVPWPSLALRPAPSSRESPDESAERELWEQGNCDAEGVAIRPISTVTGW